MPASEPDALVLTARGIIQREDRVLMVQHHYMNPANLGKWSLPGGRVAPGDEDLEATLRRELREEFQLEVEIVRFVGAYTYNGHEHHLYHARPGGDVIVPSPDEIAAVAWLTLDEIETQHAAGHLFAEFMLAAIRLVLAPEDSTAP